MIVVSGAAELFLMIVNAVYPEVGKRMAMKVDDEYVFKWITVGKFVRMAAKMGVSEKMMLREIAKMSRRIGKEAPLVARRCSREYPSPVYSSIETGIANRLKQLSSGG